MIVIFCHFMSAKLNRFRTLNCSLFIISVYLFVDHVNNKVVSRGFFHAKTRARYVSSLIARVRLVGAPGILTAVATCAGEPVSQPLPNLAKSVRKKPQKECK